MRAFNDLGLNGPLADALGSFGFEAPTAAQERAIPLLLDKKDIFLESETGTGKTFAYLAPALQLIGEGGRCKVAEPAALVAAPTQELAVQIGREAERLVMASGLAVRVLVLLGGTALDKQLARLKDKPDLVVGTLGRLRDLVAVGKLSTKALKLLVLDEADRLFAPETADMAAQLLRSAPASAARALVSATLPDRIRRAALPYLTDPVAVEAGETEVLSSDIEHWCFYCDGRKRMDFLRKFEAAVKPERCLVFLSLASRIESVAERLAGAGLPIEAIHAGLDKEARRVALERFAAGQIRYLLTSDLGARGLDIPAITHVLSLDLPEEPTIYTHRAGRTGRAGAKGVSVVLTDGVELERASKIAVRGGFVFRCKILEAAQILEPTSEEFFARARAAEDERLEAKASKLREREERSEGPRRPRLSEAGRPARGAATGAARGGPEGRGAEARGSKSAAAKGHGYKAADAKGRDAEGRGYKRAADAKGRSAEGRAAKDFGEGARRRVARSSEGRDGSESRETPPVKRVYRARGAAPQEGSLYIPRGAGRAGPEAPRGDGGASERSPERREPHGRGPARREAQDRGPDFGRGTAPRGSARDSERDYSKDRARGPDREGGSRPGAGRRIAERGAERGDERAGTYRSYEKRGDGERRSASGPRSDRGSRPGAGPRGDSARGRPFGAPGRPAGADRRGAAGPADSPRPRPGYPRAPKAGPKGAPRGAPKGGSEGRKSGPRRPSPKRGED